MYWVMSHSIMTTLRMEKTSIKLRGSFSPVMMSTTPTREISSMSRSAANCQSRSLRFKQIPQPTLPVIQHQLVQQLIDLESLRLGPRLEILEIGEQPIPKSAWFHEAHPHEGIDQLERTYACAVSVARSLLNRSNLCNVSSPAIAPPSSTRSQKNVVKTWICCRDRYRGERDLITEVRKETAFPRRIGSSSLIYSPSC